MPHPENSQFEKSLQINEWVVNARWFYMVAVFLIGILGNLLFGLFSTSSFSPLIIFTLLVVIFVNAYFYFSLTRTKKTKSAQSLRRISIGQIAMELFVFSVILYLYEDKTAASIFFFLPIISAAMIFGVRGSVITAALSALLANLPAAFGYFHYLVDSVFSRDIFSALELAEFQYRTISFIKLILTSNFYFVLAIFSGYSINFLFDREKELVKQAGELEKITAYRENELKQLDKTTKLLIKRDAMLTAINKELDKKIIDLERSEKSMLKAFSDLKEARKKAEEESNKTASIIANFIDPIIVMDEKNKIGLLNPAAKTVFGLNDSCIGQAISPESNYSMMNFFGIIKKDIKVKTSKELKSQNPDEEEVEIDFGQQKLTYKVITAGVVDRNDRHIGTMKIFYNLTREKLLDKLKSEFISIAAHQLRTPLSAIKWVIKMVLDGDAGKLNEEQEKLLFRGYESNERIIELVNDMLNVSRIEEGRFGYAFAKGDFQEIVDTVVDSLYGRIKGQKIKIIIDKPKKAPAVYMDKQKMGLVIQNLVENAVKYVPEFGTIRLATEVGKKLLRFSVKDNGIGIPEKDQEKLFSKFFRADNVVRMQTEGSGLGLFIVKNIIEGHGGDISFTSKEGVGTEFVITMPLERETGQ